MTLLYIHTIFDQLFKSNIDSIWLLYRLKYICRVTFVYLKLEEMKKKDRRNNSKDQNQNIALWWHTPRPHLKPDVGGCRQCLAKRLSLPGCCSCKENTNFSASREYTAAHCLTHTPASLTPLPHSHTCLTHLPYTPASQHSGKKKYDTADHNSWW